MPLADTLHVDASEFAWTIYLLAEVERPETLPGGVVEALGGYYDECPTLPPISDLQVARTWRSAEVKEPEPLSFKTVPPFTF
jgi:hypothetical protein